MALAKAAKPELFHRHVYSERRMFVPSSLTKNKVLSAELGGAAS